MRAFETWQVQRVACSNTSSTNVPTFKVYKGAENPSCFLGGTYTGTLDADPSINVSLGTGEVLLGVWEGADVGSVGTMTITGMKTKP
jgi:hypothetical protein